MIFPKTIKARKVADKSPTFMGFASAEPEVGQPFNMLIIKDERTYAFHTSNVTAIKSWSNERVHFATENSEYEIEAA